MALNPVELALFSSRIDAVCEEMGTVLRNAAFAPNIRDRLDFSCAIFDADGALCAQAAHIPVHLGSMAYAMAGIVARMSWHPGDVVVLNDPFLGGTHLPDVTLVAPVFVQDRLVGFVANRAHHSDIGASSPGCMPLSRSLEEEGVVIPPTHLVSGGVLDAAVLANILSRVRNQEGERGDFLAQLAAVRVGEQRLMCLIERQGPALYLSALDELNRYGERLARDALAVLPQGVYRYEDWMDDDGQGTTSIPLRVAVTIGDAGVHVDFTGTAEQVPGNINCPLSVAAAAVMYVFRCLMPRQTPACAGSFRPISLHAPEGCLLHARAPAAVAAGNVETSTRVVDLLLGALALAIPERIPAASHGSMNNLAMGSARPGGSWDYYETIGGGMGAGPEGGGWSGVQTHLTNTLNSPIEMLETRFPLRVSRYELRSGSGGAGRYPGGAGLIREFTFQAPAQVTLLTERRRFAPWGVAGGQPGACGCNTLNGRLIPGKTSLNVSPGDRLTVATPGAGGWGMPSGRAADDMCANPESVEKNG